MPNSFNKRYRFEDFIADLDAYMKANFNSFIQQMNTDKSAEATPIALAELDANAWFFQSLAENEANLFNPFVFYGETSTATNSSGPDEINRFTIQVAVILANTNESAGTMGKRLLRYRDCLKAMFNDGWNKMNKRVKLDITGISPFPFATQGTEPSHLGIGVVIEMEIA